MLNPTHLYNLQRYQVFPSKDTAVPKNLFIWPLTCDLWPLYPKFLEAKVLDQGYPSTNFGSCMYYSFWVISDTKSSVAYAHTHTHTPTHTHSHTDRCKNHQIFFRSTNLWPLTPYIRSWYETPWWAPPAPLISRGLVLQCRRYRQLHAYIAKWLQYLIPTYMYMWVMR